MSQYGDELDFDLAAPESYQAPMNLTRKLWCAAVLSVLCCWVGVSPGAEIIHVATFNVENYLDVAAGTRPAKSDAGKSKVRETILALKADVIAFQEMGNTNALLQLRSSLKSAGLDYPHWEHITGYDTNIHVAVLSKFPFTAQRPHTNDGFLLSGRRFRVSRGFAEVDIQVNPKYSFTLITAHLKSRRPVPEADEAELREQEAIVLREKIAARLAANPNVNLIVLGDLNDVQDSRSTKAVIGSRGKTALFDTRPAERNGDNQPNPNPRYDPRNITWTHYYGKEDTYSRIDYILVSQGMKREWLPEETYIGTLANWGVASDHRPI
ncbi:MAG: endonuclease/exonuclease/phosphatase family protein, partial [Verrucomicrobiota bacterium]